MTQQNPLYLYVYVYTQEKILAIVPRTRGATVSSPAMTQKKRDRKRYRKTARHKRLKRVIIPVSTNKPNQLSVHEGHSTKGFPPGYSVILEAHPLQWWTRRHGCVCTCARVHVVKASQGGGSVCLDSL